MYIKQTLCTYTVQCTVPFPFLHPFLAKKGFNYDPQDLFGCQKATTQGAKRNIPNVVFALGHPVLPH